MTDLEIELERGIDWLLNKNREDADEGIIQILYDGIQYTSRLPTEREAAE